MTATPSRRYRTVTEAGKPVRRLVVPHGKLPVEGFIRRGTMDCPNCTEYGDYGSRYGPFGCDECGHTGKRRYREWEPFDFEEYGDALTEATRGLTEIESMLLAEPTMPSPLLLPEGA